MDLKNKVALVTGAKRGIGLKIAEFLIKEGVHVALCSVSSEGSEKVVESLKALNPEAKIKYQVLDVKNFLAVKKYTDEIEKEFGKIDILINNAGVFCWGPVEELSDDDMNLMIDTNLKGPFYLMKSVIPSMKKQGWGYIVNISSVAAKTVFYGAGLYSASKAALNQMSKSAKEELRNSNIHISTINPGAVSTDIWAGVEGVDHSKMVTVEDVATSVLFVLKNSDTCTFDEIDVTPRCGKV